MQGDIERAGASTRGQLARVGAQLEAGLDATGERILGVAGRAPAAGAALGGTTGMLAGTVVTCGPGDPFTAIDVASTVCLVQQAKGSVHEAVERHGMASAVIPSLDSEIARREQAARELLQSRSTALQAEAAGRDRQARAQNPSVRTLLPGKRERRWTASSAP
ncbi:hypothetical protein [Luteimonas saliphila]|uniref:hypothetical protein n=1 Tax=Luteimonas saliphila TaxID=2804919 RepID=UPI00192E07D9|nr:hypothetical protein [Luteimonas saliphila]